MRLSLLKECIKLTLSEWTFDRAEYEAAKERMGKSSPKKNDPREPAQVGADKKSREEENKSSSREEKISSEEQPSKPKREKSVEVQFDEKQRESPASNQVKRDPSKDKAALEQVTQKVLDELEKFHNDKKSVPKTRKFTDKSFASDLQSYVKRELGNKDVQKLTTRDVEYLVNRANYQFNRYIQGKVSSK
jgi:hypothetical protein